ncbi:anti sigma factor C-terminal domain-containing protein [Clostridium sp. FP1]|uniref:anti sigma factor C-terminal domain-containing protein n=1 Tax=Clostridium sp. FP1 TaxID=2724076 RepID=UPI0013E8FD9D|nr:anti sigma factor C-terminal domain-containing protein [Clostridium sp. FP1]MBZ9637197.1 anti-sigma factor [Clostridium sp. FP1]
MKSDDEKLRELFEVKEKPTFNNTIKRAKTFSIIRTIIVSFMILIIVSFIVLMLNATILNTMSNKTEDELEDWFNVAMPNAYVGNTQVDDRIMVGQIDYVRYRFLGSKPITDGSYKEGYTYMPLINGIYGDMGDYLFESAAESTEDLDKITKFNKVGKHVMKFYNPATKYESYINDLVDLNEIGSNKLMEISLSFDKTYSLEQVKTMIPRDITLNWYWVNTFSKNDKYDSSKSILEEYDVYGIKALDRQGISIKNPEKDFIDAIIRGKGKKDYSGRYERLYNTLSNGNDEINKEDLKIIGVVVSGNVEDLKALKDKKYIKAATIGAVTDKY